MRTAIPHDFHLHSDYSDGQPLVRLLREAEALGLDTIEIADHLLICHVGKQERFSYSMPVGAISDRRTELARFRDRSSISLVEGV